jgi:hypothetical protein
MSLLYIIEMVTYMFPIFQTIDLDAKGQSIRVVMAAYVSLKISDR